jgi:hypothetical protein
MNKIREIIGAWLISFNPSKERKELAEKRYEICLGCEHYRKSRPITQDEHCLQCGCPIQKKVFTERLDDSCPLNKWSHVDSTYINQINKKPKSII